MATPSSSDSSHFAYRRPLTLLIRQSIDERTPAELTLTVFDGKIEDMWFGRRMSDLRGLIVIDCAVPGVIYLTNYRLFIGAVISDGVFRISVGNEGKLRHYRAVSLRTSLVSASLFDDVPVTCNYARIDESIGVRQLSKGSFDLPTGFTLIDKKVRKSPESMGSRTPVPPPHLCESPSKSSSSLVRPHSSLKSGAPTLPKNVSKPVREPVPSTRAQLSLTVAGGASGGAPDPERPKGGEGKSKNNKREKNKKRKERKRANEIGVGLSAPEDADYQDAKKDGRRHSIKMGEPDSSSFTEDSGVIAADVRPGISTDSNLTSDSTASVVRRFEALDPLDLNNLTLMQDTVISDQVVDMTDRFHVYLNTAESTNSSDFPSDSSSGEETTALLLRQAIDKDIEADFGNLFLKVDCDRLTICSAFAAKDVIAVVALKDNARRYCFEERFEVFRLRSDHFSIDDLANPARLRKIPHDTKLKLELVTDSSEAKYVLMRISSGVLVVSAIA